MKFLYKKWISATFFPKESTWFPGNLCFNGLVIINKNLRVRM